MHHGEIPVVWGGQPRVSGLINSGRNASVNGVGVPTAARTELGTGSLPPRKSAANSVTLRALRRSCGGHHRRRRASLPVTMVPAAKKLRTVSLRAVLAALLMLHGGLSQSTAGHAGMARVTLGAAQAAMHNVVNTPACHLAAGASDTRHVPCCTAGDCHCAGACYQGVELATLAGGPIVRGIEPIFTDPAIPPPQPARQFRPPIQS